MIATKSSLYFLLDPVGCLYKPVPEEIAQFASIETHQIFECGFGTVWDQDICSCVIGK